MGRPNGLETVLQMCVCNGSAWSQPWVREFQRWSSFLGIDEALAIASLAAAAGHPQLDN